MEALNGDAEERADEGAGGGADEAEDVGVRKRMRRVCQ